MSGQGKRRESGPDLPHEVILQLFSYCPDTGVVTRHGIWSRRTSRVVFQVSRDIGQERLCGGRRTVCIDRSRYTLTHLIWYLQKGHWPTILEEVDHWNHDHLDDSWGNLRLTDRGGNMMNCRKRKRPSTSTYVGVRCRGENRWTASVKSVNGSPTHVGRFRTEIEAAKARDAAAVSLFGDSVYLNFPEDQRDKR